MECYNRGRAAGKFLVALIATIPSAPGFSPTLSPPPTPGFSWGTKKFIFPINIPHFWMTIIHTYIFLVADHPIAWTTSAPHQTQTGTPSRTTIGCKKVSSHFFCGNFFLLRIPWYGKITVWKVKFSPPPPSRTSIRPSQKTQSKSTKDPPKTG